jgi:hypothetical protein
MVVQQSAHMAWKVVKDTVMMLKRHAVANIKGRDVSSSKKENQHIPI